MPALTDMTAGNESRSLGGLDDVVVTAVQIMEGIASRWAPELDDIAFGVCEIHGRTLTLGTIARLDVSSLHHMSVKVNANTGFIKGLHAKTKMIKVACLCSRWRTSSLAEFAIDKQSTHCEPSWR